MLTNSILRALPEEARYLKQMEEWYKICASPVYFIENYVFIDDSQTKKEIQFKLYKYQKKASKDFTKKKLNLTMKTRQTGLTTLSQAFAFWWMITKEKQVIKCIANRKTVSVKFLTGMKAMMESTKRKTGDKYLTKDKKTKYKSWLVPDFMPDLNGKEAYGILNGSIIAAEGNNPEAGRGDTINLLIIDEVASIDYQRKTAMEDIWASAGPALTRSGGTCIAISTPKGKSGWYFEQYINAEEKGWNIIEAPWQQHPLYNLGMYQYIPDKNDPNNITKGYIKFFNEGWPDVSHPDDLKKYKTKDTYTFIRDGKLRSPWYDVESKKLGKNRTACELDCSFSGSGGEVLDMEVLKDISNTIIKPKRIGDRLGSTEIFWKDYFVYREFNDKDIYAELFENDENLDLENSDDFLITVDISTGDGSDTSTITVINMPDMEICATFKNRQITPEMLAYYVVNIANEYGNPMVVVENNGPGLTTLLELKKIYSDKKIYKTALKKKDPTQKDGRKVKLGLWQSNESRRLGGDGLEELLTKGKIKLNCKRIYKELETWVWKDGRRDHLPGKNDDLIMGLANGIYVIKYTLSYYERKKKNANIVKQISIRPSNNILVNDNRRYLRNNIDKDGFLIR